MAVTLMALLVGLAAYGVSVLFVIKKQNYMLIEMLRRQNGWGVEDMDEIAENALSKTWISEKNSTEE